MPTQLSQPLWITLYFSLVWLLLVPALYANNSGKGPVPVRNQFPFGLVFLNAVPESPRLVSPGKLGFHYQWVIGNTFINTRGDSPDLRPKVVNDGIDKEEIIIHQIEQPRNGFNVYLDVETYRHAFNFKFGLPYRMELGVEFSLLSYRGGVLDRPIEVVHEMTGVDNSAEEGGFRSYSDRNRFDFYLIRNNRFIYQENKPFDFIPGDMVFTLKHQLTEGSHWWPAITLKLAHKVPWDSADHYPRNLVSSGQPDSGWYLLFGKRVMDSDFYIYHLTGQTGLTIKNDDFQTRLKHNIFSLEYQSSSATSWLLQWAWQSSIFPSRSEPLAGTFRELVVDRGLGRPTEVATFALRWDHEKRLYSFGFKEDMNQTRNQIDFVVFVAAEWPEFNWL